MTNIRHRSLFFVFALFFTVLNAQNQNEEYLTWFDKAIGVQNTPLYEGLGYVEQFKSINEKHKFFNSEKLLNGSIVYDGQAYHNLKLKYDMYTDDVVIRLNDGFEIILLQPEKSKIKNFTIDGSSFENIGSPEGSNTKIRGFFEVLFASQTFRLLRKHHKKRSMKIDDIVYYEFNDDNFMVLQYEGLYHIVESTRDFRRIFPEYKKEIRKYKIKKSNERSSMIALSKRLYLLMSTEKTQ